MHEDALDNAPHLTVPTLDGNVHVIPEDLLRNWIDGIGDIDDLEDKDILLRSIVAEWLNFVERKPEETEGGFE